MSEVGMGETQTGSGRSGPSFATIVLVALLAAGVIGALIGVVIVRATDSDVAALTLEPANAAGANPFTASVASTGGPANANTQTAINATRASFTKDPNTGALIAPADAPGLYGGSGDTKVCNPQQLVDFLAQDQAKAKAWASVLDISTDDIATYIGSLTPVLLTNDTLVTNHGYNNGKATSTQSVLQAGTAVMVDATGTPRVKCNCGNPLTEPQTITLSNAKLTGTAWPNYDINNFTTIHATTQITNLTIINIQTGTTYTQPMPVTPNPTSQQAGPGVLVTLGFASLGESPTTSLYITNVANLSASEMVFNAPDGLYGVGFGNDMFVAVGEEAVYTSDATGRSWTKAATVPAYLNDVAFGAGKWLASGTSVSSTGDGDAVLYQSTDARTWTKIETSLPSAGTSSLFGSVAFGDDLWVASQSGSVGGSYESRLYTSADGVSWAPASASGGGTLGYADGVGWLAMGEAGTTGSGVPPAGVARRSTDGITWSETATTPPDTSFSGSLVFIDGRWYTGAWNPGALGFQGVVTSTDGITWSLAGTPSDTVVDIAYSGGSGTDGSAEGATNTTAASDPPCTNDAIQAALQNTANATSVAALRCNGSWAAVAGISFKDGTEGNALFRAKGDQWEYRGKCSDPDIPPDIYQVACTSS
jgi:hypothetical protein